MKLLIVAVGQRVPDWAQTAYDDYAKRFPPELKVELKAVKTEPRGSKTVATLISERVGAETASQQLGHSSPAITREFYVSKPAIAADVAHVLEELGCSKPDDGAILGE